MEKNIYNSEGVTDIDGVSTCDQLYLDYKYQWDIIAD